MGTSTDPAEMVATNGPNEALQSEIARFRRITFAGVIIGSILVAFADRIAHGITWAMPDRARISSSGTGVETLDVLGPEIVRRSGIVLLLAAVISVFASMWRSDTIIRVRLLTPAVIVATGVWYGWLAEPHNAFYTNARFHWVDYLTWDSDRFVYAAGRVPHLIFYESPYLWQAINAAAMAYVFYSIARHLDLSAAMSTAIAAVPAISGNLLLFANTAEDVVLNTTLLAVVILVALRRQPVMLGLALGLASLGRPSFVILIVCVAAAEVAVSLRHRTGFRGTDWRYLAASTGTAIGFVMLGQLTFAVLGDRYFFVDGQVIRTDQLEQWSPRPIEGFTISPLSGAYALHLLWVMPLFLLLGATCSVFTASGQSRRIEALIYTSGFFVLAHVLVHESKPLAYYNARYLAYVFPFLFFMSTTLLAHRRLPAANSIRAAGLTLLVAGTAVFPADPIEAKRWVEDRPETVLLSARNELRDVTSDKFVFLDFGDVLSRNYVAYVLRRDIATIQLIGESSQLPQRPDTPGRGEDLGPDEIVISLRDDPWSTAPPVLEIGDFAVFEVSGGRR